MQGCPSVICALPDPRLVSRRPAPWTWSVLRSPRHLGLVVASAPGCREGTCGGIHGCRARRALGGCTPCGGLGGRLRLTSSAEGRGFCLGWGGGHRQAGSHCFSDLPQLSHFRARHPQGATAGYPVTSLAPGTLHRRQG